MFCGFARIPRCIFLNSSTSTTCLVSLPLFITFSSLLEGYSRFPICVFPNKSFNRFGVLSLTLGASESEPLRLWRSLRLWAHVGSTLATTCGLLLYLTPPPITSNIPSIHRRTTPVLNLHCSPDRYLRIDSYVDTGKDGNFAKRVPVPIQYDARRAMP